MTKDKRLTSQSWHKKKLGH